MEKKPKYFEKILTVLSSLVKISEPIPFFLSNKFNDRDNDGKEISPEKRKHLDLLHIPIALALLGLALPGFLLNPKKITESILSQFGSDAVIAFRKHYEEKI